MFIESGIAPSTLGEEDFFEFLEIMKAKSEDERPVDPSIAFANMMKQIQS